MSTSPCQLLGLPDLRNYVNETLCHHENLEIGAYPITERILMRRGRPCGIFFCLHGPSAVKFTAIWETEQNTILFYDSGGDRFDRTQLVAAPNLERVASQHAAKLAVDRPVPRHAFSERAHLPQP